MGSEKHSLEPCFFHGRKRGCAKLSGACTDFTVTVTTICLLPWLTATLPGTSNSQLCAVFFRKVFRALHSRAKETGSEHGTTLLMLRFKIPKVFPEIARLDGRRLKESLLLEKNTNSF